MFAIKDLQSQLQTLTYRKEDGRRIRSRTRWMKSRDRMNKCFFPLVKERPTVGLITKLYDEDDTFVSLRAYLAMVCNTLYSWVCGSFKHFYLANRICKSCWGTTLSNSNLLIMVHGALPLSSCYLLTSLSKAGHNIGVILLKHGRWWHTWWLSFLYLAWRIFYNLTFDGKLNTKVCTSVLPWIGVLYFIEKVWDTSGILGTCGGMAFFFF